LKEKLEKGEMKASWERSFGFAYNDLEWRRRRETFTTRRGVV